jgi:hypothetical protein
LDRQEEAERQVQELLLTGTDKHSDVLLKRKGVEALRRQVVESKNTVPQKQSESVDVAPRKKQLAPLRLTQSPKHANVVALQTRIGKLEAKAGGKK